MIMDTTTSKTAVGIESGVIASREEITRRVMCGIDNKSLLTSGWNLFIYKVQADNASLSVGRYQSWDDSSS
jgi:hypothetical protein